jgi:hypothetical protein
LKELSSKFEFVKKIDDNLPQKYGIDTTQNFIYIDADLSESINQKNSTDFSQNFTAYLIYVYLSNKFELVGEVEDVLIPKTFKDSDRYNWNNFYLVNKDLVNKFDFDAFAYDIEKRLNDKIDESYTLNFKGYLIDFLNVDNIDLLSMLDRIAEKIINLEFALYIDLDNNIIFKRNTVKQVYEYAYKALEHLGQPSRVDEITNKITKLYPNYEIDDSKTRAAMIRSKGFVPIGRKSVYGLKVWEEELENFRGGTIKDIVLEYLQDKQEPIHVDELFNEVNKYRKGTNVKNIVTNIKLDPQKRFVVFNQGFVGLSWKSYSSKLTDLPKFLGKRITSFIKQKNNVNLPMVAQHFSDIEKISPENMKMIILQLIENEFVRIDDQNNLYI